MASHYAAPPAFKPGAAASQTRPSGYLAIVNNPTYQELVRARTSLGRTLSIATLAIYVGFLLLVAFGKGLLAAKIGNSTTSLGIVLGLVIIVLAFVVTAIYVVRANGKFDDLSERLKREAGV